MKQFKQYLREQLNRTIQLEMVGLNYAGLADHMTIHGENEHWIVAQPHTTEGAIALSKGTRWETAQKEEKNTFPFYDKHGSMLMLLPKNPTSKGEKYVGWLPTKYQSEPGVRGPRPEFIDSLNRRYSDIPTSPFSDPDRPLPEISNEEVAGMIDTLRQHHEAPPDYTEPMF